MSKTTPQSKDRLVLQTLGEDILDHLKEIAEEGERLMSEGMITVPVKYEDGSFKNKPIGHRWMFFPQYVYVGARGQLIFGFSTADQPIDPEKPQWEYAEFDAKKIDEAFPMVLPALCQRYEVKQFNLMSDLIDHLYARESVQKEIQAETDEEKMRANPLFGLF